MFTYPVINLEQTGKNIKQLRIKNNLSVNEANYLLVDIRTGLYVFSAKSKKALFEIYQQQKEKYDNYLSQYEKLVIKFEKELKELIEKGKLDKDVNYDIYDTDD